MTVKNLKTSTKSVVLFEEFNKSPEMSHSVSPKKPIELELDSTHDHLLAEKETNDPLVINLRFYLDSLIS